METTATGSSAAQNATRAEYRGLSEPVSDRPATVSRPLVTPFGPLASPKAAIASTAHSYPASDVLAGSLQAWRSADADGPGQLRRYNPTVCFAGIDTQWDSLAPMLNGVALKPAHGVTLVPNGGLLFFASINDESGALVSAHIEPNGELKLLDMMITGVLSDAPVVTSKGATLLTCDYLKTATLHADGTIRRQINAFPGHQNPTLLRSDVALFTKNNALELAAVPHAGELRSLDSAALGHSASNRDVITVRNGVVVVNDAQTISTFTFGNDKLTKVASRALASGTNHFGSAIIAGNGVVLAFDRGLVAVPVAKDGSIGERRQLPIAAASGFVAATGNFAIVACLESLHVVRFDAHGEMAQTDTYRLEGDVRARPTITSDGVVLVGTSAGHVYALQLGADGKLTEKAPKKSLGAPIVNRITMTEGGFALVQAGDQLISLRGKVTS